MILIQKNNDTSTVEPIVLQNTGVSSPKNLNLKPIDLHSADDVIDEKDMGDTKIYGSATEINNAPVTSDSSLALDSTDKIYIPDVEFKSGSLTAVLNSIGQPSSEKAIIVTNGNMTAEGTYAKQYIGQDVNPTAVVARGKLVSSPIVGIEIAEKAEDTEEHPWEKELYLGVTRLDSLRKEVTNKRVRITRNEEIYRVKDQVNNLLSTIPDVGKKATDAEKFVTVEVHTENGGLKSVNVSTADIASATKLNEVSTRVNDNKNTYDDFIANKWNKQDQKVEIKDPYKSYVTVNVETDASGRIITGTQDHSYVHIVYSNAEGQKGIVVDSEIPRLIDTSIKDASKYADDRRRDLSTDVSNKLTQIWDKLGKHDTSLDNIFDVSHVHVAINASDNRYLTLELPTDGRNSLLSKGSITVKYASYNEDGSLSSHGFIDSRNIVDIKRHIDASISRHTDQITSLFGNCDYYTNTIFPDLSTRINNNTSFISNVINPSIIRIEQRLNSNDGNIDIINNRLDEHDEHFTLVDNALAKHTTDIATINTHEGLCDKRIDKHDEDISTLMSMKHTHSAIRGGDNKSLINASINYSGNSLSSTMILKTTYHTYGDEEDINQTDIPNGIIDWEALRPYLKDIWDYQQKNNLNISRILSEISDINSKINSVKDDVAKNATNILLIQQALNTVETNVYQNAADIDKLEAAVASHTTRISVNETQITNIKNDLSSLTNTVSHINSCQCTVTASDISDLAGRITDVSKYAIDHACNCSGTSVTPYDDTALKNQITSLTSLINNVSTYAHENACKCSNPSTAEYTPVFLSLS